MSTIHCDRCNIDKEGEVGLHFSAGCYLRSGWARFMRNEEEIVCDDCMWKDPRYIAEFGVQVSEVVY